MSTTNADVATLIEAVEADERLLPEEKETTIRFAWGDECASVFSAEPGIMRRLLAHPERRDTRLVLTDGEARPTVTPEEYAGLPISGVTTELPVGVLKIQPTARTTGGHATIVTREHLSEVGE
jgi:hypothetical protein